LDKAFGEGVSAPSPIFLQDRARPAPAFSIFPTDLEPGTGYLISCHFKLVISSKLQQNPRRKAPYVEIFVRHVLARYMLGYHFNFVAYLVKKYCFARAFNPE